MKPSQLLQKCHAFLSKRGAWNRHGTPTVDANGKTVACCTIQVSNSVLANDGVNRYTDTAVYADRYLSLAHSGTIDMGALIVFNDNPKTRKKDVLALFRKAIRLARRYGR